MFEGCIKHNSKRVYRTIMVNSEKPNSKDGGRKVTANR